MDGVSSLDASLGKKSKRPRRKSPPEVRHRVICTVGDTRLGGVDQIAGWDPLIPLGTSFAPLGQLRSISPNLYAQACSLLPAGREGTARRKGHGAVSASENTHEWARA